MPRRLARFVAAIMLSGVGKRFPDGTVAVAALNLEIGDGELMVLVGPSGCGKSTVLRMVAGLEQPTEGTIAIGGRVVDDLSPGDRDVAMVFQDYALYPHMSAHQNIAFALKPQRLGRRETDRRVREAARVLGIEQLLRRRPRALSGGERQRVAMGRALVRQPRAFLMDEPLSNLDAKLRVQLRAEIRRLHDELRTTFLYVTHDQVEAMTIGDRVAVLRRGERQQAGTPSELYAAPANVFVAGFIGSPAINLFLVDVVTEGDGPAATVGPWTLPLPDRAADHGQLIVGIRPEQFFDPRFSRAGDPARVAELPVSLVEPLGPTTLVHVVVAQTQVGVPDLVASAPGRDFEIDEQARVAVASLDGRTTARPGETIALGVDAERVLLFDAGSGTLL